MNNPLVTIAIPAYKCDYLKDAIQSAINQTYNNIEILIVDDKSPYDVYSIVNTFNDSRIRYIRNSENIGGEDPANNWNKCLREAQGDYFCLLCDDDLYMPTFVEMMLKLATKYEHTHIFRSRVSVIDIEGKRYLNLCTSEMSLLKKVDIVIYQKQCVPIILQSSCNHNMGG